jgi:PAS domain S-box-containing protein
MSSVTVVWSMIGAACLTLAAIHFPVWWRNREAIGTLSFAIAAAATAAIACCELFMLKATTPAGYATAMRWIHVPVAVLLVALAGFTFHYLESGRRWLAVAAIGLRLVSLAIDFTVGENLNWYEVRSLGELSFLGDTVRVPVGVPNPWMAVGQLAVLLLAIFILDAAVGAWRRGRRTVGVVVVGGILTLLTLSAGGMAVILYWGAVQAPSTLALYCLGIVVLMAYALSSDLLRARQLVIELSEKEQEAALAAEAANLGTFTRDIPRDVIDASDEWRDLFGFGPHDKLNLAAMMQKIHVDDRGALAESLARSLRDPATQHAEFRVPLADGRTRWISAIGRLELDKRGRPLRSRGACIDITARKLAEQEMLHLRQEIVHVGRVSVMGQLASALAHEINQPLSAILRNAEAAALFMQDPSPDLAEITAILEDIRKDDQRAGAVIDRMRALLRRREVEMKPIDVAQMLDDVATLLRPDAAARHIAIDIDVAPDLPAIHGDRVQLQQVLLNLLLNGMDAIGAGDRRRIAVTVRRDGAGALAFDIADTGTGIDRAHLERSSSRSSPPRRAASAWACRSRAASSRPTTATSGRRTTPRAERTFRFTSGSIRAAVSPERASAARKRGTPQVIKSGKLAHRDLSNQLHAT